MTGGFALRRLLNNHHLDDEEQMDLIDFAFFGRGVDKALYRCRHPHRNGLGGLQNEKTLVACSTTDIDYNLDERDRTFISLARRKIRP